MLSKHLPRDQIRKDDIYIQFYGKILMRFPWNIGLARHPN